MQLLHGSIEKLSIVHLQHFTKYRQQERNTNNDEALKMAYYTQTHSSPASVVERILEASANLLHAASARYARYRVYNDTYNELSQLGDRELNDLGMSRSMIRGLALETAENYTGK